LDPDKFRKWANILEQLTRDELIVIGKAIALTRKMQVFNAGDFWKTLKSELEAAGYQSAVIAPLCASLSRTGLLLPASAWGGMIYMPTPWLDELGKIADIEGMAAAK
jgi:hypothetical protein